MGHAEGEAGSDLAREKLGNRRVTGKEQYYTPPAIAAQVCDLVQRHVPDSDKRTWLEPAGGTGVFIEEARSRDVGRIVSFDIEPLHPGVEAGDFLHQNLELSGAVAVSNPPFGRNNALSVPFFNRCATYCDFIAFIVPRSWRKWSVTNRLDLRFHLVEDVDLSINYVDATGVSNHANNNLRTCVQLWEKRSELREKIKIPDYAVVRKTTPEAADVALTVFGFSCGTVKTDFPRRRITTEMYLKLEHPQALEALQKVDFSRFYNNVAYTEALAFPEINYLLNEYLFGSPFGDGSQIPLDQGSLF